MNDNKLSKEISKEDRKTYARSVKRRNNFDDESSKKAKRLALTTLKTRGSKTINQATECARKLKETLAAKTDENLVQEAQVWLAERFFSLIEEDGEDEFDLALCATLEKSEKISVPNLNLIPDPEQGPSPTKDAVPNTETVRDSDMLNAEMDESSKSAHKTEETTTMQEPDISACQDQEQQRETPTQSINTVELTPKQVPIMLQCPACREVVAKGMLTVCVNRHFCCAKCLELQVEDLFLEKVLQCNVA